MSINQPESSVQPNVQSISTGKLTWVYIEKPTQVEVDYLSNNYPFHPLNLDDILSRIQRPKIDVYNDHLFIVLHFPVFDKENRVTNPSELDIFIGENYLITVHCNGDLKPLSSFFKACHLDDHTCQTFMMRNTSFLLYHILDSLVNYCFPILDRVSANIEKIEDLIFTQTVPETVREISLIRRDLISFRRVIHPQIVVIELLEKSKYAFFKEEQDVYFGDIADHVRKIWDGLEDCKEEVDGLADTSNWLTSHRIQEVMRVLTIVMAVMTPLTLLSSVYGMNIFLPGGIEPAQNLHTFMVIILIMLMIVGGMLYYFKRKHFL